MTVFLKDTGCHILQSFKETGNRIGQKGMPHSQQGVRKVKTHQMDDFKC